MMAAWWYLLICKIQLYVSTDKLMICDPCLGTFSCKRENPVYPVYIFWDRIYRMSLTSCPLRGSLHNHDHEKHGDGVLHLNSVIQLVWWVDTIAKYRNVSANELSSDAIELKKRKHPSAWNCIISLYFFWFKYGELLRCMGFALTKSSNKRTDK